MNLLSINLLSTHLISLLRSRIVASDESAARVLLEVQYGTDETLSLLAWLKREDSFRGHVELLHVPPAPGHMGSALETVSVLAGSGGAVTALVGTLSVWMRNRGAKVAVKITKGRRSVTLSGDRVHKAELAQLEMLAVEVAKALDED